MNDELFDFDTLHRLIPHSDKMCLWEAVTAFDDDSIKCRTTRHLDLDHPLKRDGRLSKLHLIEFGAQTIAIHGGLKAQAEAENTASPFAKTPRPGYLASVKNITFGDFNPQTAVLTGQATQLMADDASKLYQFELQDQNGQTVCSGRALVIHPED